MCIQGVQFKTLLARFSLYKAEYNASFMLILSSILFLTNANNETCAPYKLTTSINFDALYRSNGKT